MTSLPKDADDLIKACSRMVERTGATNFQIRYSDDEVPTIWIAVAVYANGGAEAAASIHPVEAAWRLCEQLIDGGTCQHCDRGTILVRAEDDGLAAHSGMNLCQYTYRNGEIQRGCG